MNEFVTEKDVETTISSSEVPPITSSDPSFGSNIIDVHAVLNDENLLLDSSTFITSIQDTGEELEGHEKKKMKHYKRKGDPLWYKEIYHLGEALLSVYSLHKDTYFPRLPTNKTDSRTKLCGWIYTHRVLKGRGDIDDSQLLALPYPSPIVLFAMTCARY